MQYTYYLITTTIFTAYSLHMYNTNIQLYFQLSKTLDRLTQQRKEPGGHYIRTTLHRKTFQRIYIFQNNNFKKLFNLHNLDLCQPV